MILAPYPYRVRASLDERPLAESDGCLYLQRPGEPPVLYFPPSDIDLSLFEAAGTTTDDEGPVELWRAVASGPLATVAFLSSPPAPLAAARGYGRFDPELVRVEVLEGLPDSEERDTSIKRFPTWGDATHLFDMLDVRREGDLGFTSVAHTDGRRPVVEGSQMLGQAIVAASRHSPQRRIVSASMLFLRGADAALPLQFTLDVLSSGRTFTALAVQVHQSGRCCAAGTILLDTTAPDVVSHAVEAPKVSGPYQCEPYDMGLTGRDIRVVDGAYTNDPTAPTGPPVLDAWVRFRQVPDDPALHIGLLAQFTGHMPIAAALRPHPGVGQSQAHRTLSMGINAINLSLHREVRADDWMLYHHHSTSAIGGMTHAECRVHNEDGLLLASFTVDGMVRPFAGGNNTRDERSAL